MQIGLMPLLCDEVSWIATWFFRMTRGSANGQGRYTMPAFFGQTTKKMGIFHSPRRRKIFDTGMGWLGAGGEGR